MRSHDLNKLLVRADSAVSLLLTASLIAPTSVVVLLFPIIGFALQRFFLSFMRFLRLERRIQPLPKDFKAMVKTLMPVPRNVVFLRGKGNDCESRSFWLVHFILIPEGFEYDLEAPHNQGHLLHELGHGSFFDFLSLSLLQLSGLLFLVLIFWPVLTYLNPDLTPMEPDDAKKFFPFVIIAALSFVNFVGVFHRRERNADVEAYRKNATFTEAYIKQKIRNNKYFKRRRGDFETAIKNAIFHPSFKSRLDFLHGDQSPRNWLLVFPTITYGFCIVILPVFSAVIPIIAITNAMNGEEILKPVVVSALCFTALYQIAGFINAYFQNEQVANRTQKIIVFLGLLVGAEICAASFLVFPKFVPEIDGLKAFLYFEPSQELIPVLAGIPLGFLQFFIALQLHRFFGKKTILSGYVMPIYMLVGCITVKTLELNVPISLHLALLFAALELLIAPLIIFGIDLLLHTIFRVSRKKPSEKSLAKNHA
nr:hypothetical protein [uncultured Cohaesibacter sp.]